MLLISVLKTVKTISVGELRRFINASKKERKVHFSVA
jgi:hypothetical protein